MKKILVVEDDRAILKAWEYAQTIFKPELVIITASTVDAARAAFQTNPDVDIIVMDGGLQTKNDAIPLVKEIRQTYTGPIVAASGSRESQKLLMESGCSHECPMKPMCASYALGLIGIDL